MTDEPREAELLEAFARLGARRERDRLGLHLLEGIKSFVHACDAGVAFEAIVHDRILLRSDLAQMLVRRKRREGVRTLAVTPERFRVFSRAARASGVAAIARQRWTRLAEIHPARGLCWIALERIRSPGNLGTILRTAEAAGVAGVILLGPAVDPFEPAVVRASMGGLFGVRLVRTTHARFARWARRARVCVVGTSPRARLLYTEPMRPGPTVLMIGEERTGLSTEASALCERSVRIPIAGRADSLNVAVASGVLLYELVRQRAAGPA